MGDRMAIAQMSSESGAAAAFFPPDRQTLEYFRKKLSVTPSGSSSSELEADALSAFFNNGSVLFQSHDAEEGPQKPRRSPVYETVIEMDVRDIVPSATGPRGASHRVPLDRVKEDFDSCKNEVRMRVKARQPTRGRYFDLIL